MMRVLAGDIGGTNSRLAVCDVAGGRVTAVAENVYPSASFASLTEVVRTFLSGQGEIRAACFGLPGPVRGRRVQLTNLPWLVDADVLERELGLDNAWLLNDLEANAYGLSVLEPSGLRLIKPGNAVANGNAALIAAGTGLGQAGLTWDGTRRRPFATEGGHTDFAPSDDFEAALLERLRGQHGHVSWERVVSGPGLVTIESFVRERAGGPSAPWANQAITDRPSQIAAAALDGSDPIAAEALSRFLALYGAEAGNLCLKVLATAGVYVGGGIAPKIAAAFENSEFAARFVAKGRMRGLLEDIPVWLVLDRRTGLWGAASFAASRGQGNA